MVYRSGVSHTRNSAPVNHAENQMPVMGRQADPASAVRLSVVKNKELDNIPAGKNVVSDALLTSPREVESPK